MTDQILREGADLASSVAGDLRTVGPLTVTLHEPGATATSWDSSAARHDVERAVTDAVMVAVTAPHRPAGFAVTTHSELLNARSLLVIATVLVRPGSEASQAFTATLDGAAGAAHVSLRGSPSIDGVPWQAPSSTRPALSGAGNGAITPTSPSPAWPPAPLPVAPTRATPRATPPPSRPPAGSRPAARPGNAVLGSVAVGYVLFSMLWKLAIFVLVIGSIVGYIWGGGNDAHVRCLDHRLGAPGLIDNLACVFEH